MITMICIMFYITQVTICFALVLKSIDAKGLRKEW